MFDIWIETNITLTIMTIDGFDTAKDLANIIKEEKSYAEVTVRRHRQDIGIIYKA